MIGQVSENSMDRTANQHPVKPQGSVDKDIIGIQIAIGSSNGLLQELWIPYNSDGIYKIQDDSGKNEILKIQKKGDYWYALCSSGIRCSDSQTREIPLVRSSLSHLTGNKDNYFIYSENINSEARICHNYLVEKDRAISIGRADYCGICVANDYVSRQHATLSWDEKGWHIRDTNSTNGVFVNGRLIREATLACGDDIFIMGLKIVVGYEFISINDGNNRVRITSPYVRPILTRKDIAFSTPDAKRTSAAEYFNRLPREREPLKAEPITFDNPPPSLVGNQVPFFLRMGNPTLMGSNALLMGNYLMAATSLVMPFLTQGYSEKERNEYEKQRKEKYAAYLVSKKKQIHDECREEERILRDTYPSINKVILWPDSQRRFWERRNVDDDFLKIRIGYGDYPMLAPFDCYDERFTVKEDPLETTMREIVNNPPLLHNAPVLTSLTEDFVCGVIGDREPVLKFVRNMMTQIVMSHSYDEVKIILLCNEEDMKRFEPFRFQLHMWDDARTIRLLAFTIPEAARIGAYLGEQIEADVDKPRELKKILKERPNYVIFALDRKLFEVSESVKNVLKQDKSIGVSIIAAFPEVPKECTKVFYVSDKGNRTTFLKDPEHYPETFQMDNCDERYLSFALHKSANVKVRTVEAGFMLPQSVSFLEMFEVGRIEHLAPLRRWAENNPIKSLAVPVGIGTDGELFTLDLHQKYQGPHGLVAGTTGSGKSEFLITYILSLAVNFSPDEVSFLLIDYKGGGLAGAFCDEVQDVYLPHVVGTITNLDGAAIQRSLVSINAELKRRQRVFNDAKSITNSGTMDIYDYQRLFRSGRIKEPMPHLFIISDEFAELKAQQPEFLAELISAARIGRSLGVHLILATQKPAGVVNDQIVSNTKFRVCLRVADRADSMDMLKRPEASELRDTGRFYLQVGNNEYFALGQSAWCGAAYEPQDEVVKQVDQRVSVLDPTGQSIISVEPEKKKTKSDQKQLVAVVKMLSDLAVNRGMKPKPLWMDPLENTLSLAEESKKNDQLLPFNVYVGKIDDPEQQTQHTLFVDLLKSKNIMIAGGSGSGKTTFLKTILHEVIRHYSPEDIVFYLADFSGRTLNSFTPAPHCGVFVDDENEQNFNRLLDLLKEMVEERKKLFSEASVSDFESYIAIKKLPLVLVVIDNVAGISNFAKGTDILTSISQYFKEGLSYGIRYIVTLTHLNELNSKAKQEMDTRFAMQMKDKYEFTDALNNVRCSYIPPSVAGRGLCLYDGRPLEYQVAILNPEDSAQERNAAILEAAKEAAQRYKDDTPAKSLQIVDEKQEYEAFCADIPKGRIPLGYSLKDARKVSIPLKQAYCLSLYFGNPTGRKKLFSNFVYAFRREGGRIIVVPKTAGSVLTGGEGAVQLNDGDLVIHDTANGAKELTEALSDLIMERKAVRNRYCEEHNLEQSNINSLMAASDTIRRETDPCFVIIENYAEFALTAEEATPKIWATIMQIARYYNICFLAGYEPDDTGKLAGNAVQTAFNPDKNTILFGGQMDKQNLVTLDYKSSIKTIIPKIGRGLMEYRGETYSISMPCGEMQQADVNEEDASIF